MIFLNDENRTENKTEIFSEIKVFENQEFGQLRSMEIDGVVWFIGKDVAEALGYTKARNAISAHVDDEDKTLAPIQGGCSTGIQNTILINESGLYSLILSSKIPSAKKFKHWVTSEVLPSIRKHGAYISPNSNIAQMTGVQNAQDLEAYLTMLCDSLSFLQSQVIDIQTSLAAITSQSKLPDSPDSKSINTWKKYVAQPLVDKLLKAIGVDVSIKTVYRCIYNTMSDMYGFCESVAINDYNNKYAEPATSTVNVIAADRTYSQWFVSATKELINKIKNKKQDESPASLIGRQVTIDDSVEDVVQHIASLINDKTHKQLRTRRMIYAEINTERGWKTAMTRNHYRLKRDLVEFVPKYRKRFLVVCNQLIDSIYEQNKGDDNKNDEVSIEAKNLDYKAGDANED